MRHALAGAMLSLVFLTAQKVEAQATTGRITKLANVTIFVRDYEEAIAWYEGKLGFVKLEDRRFGENYRWVTMAPSRESPVRIVLSRPSETMDAKEHQALIGGQELWVFHTDDCEKAYQRMAALGVKFIELPQKQPYGTQAIFEDLYGNQFVLVQI